MDEDQADLVFQAMSHRARREILDIVKSRPGCTVGEVASRFDTSRVAVVKHLALLEQAGLIVKKKQGAARTLYLNVMPIQLIYDRWSDEYGAFWAGHLADLKYNVEGRRRGEDDE